MNIPSPPNNNDVKRIQLKAWYQKPNMWKSYQFKIMFTREKSFSLCVCLYVVLDDTISLAPPPFLFVLNHCSDYQEKKNLHTICRFFFWNIKKKIICYFKFNQPICITNKYSFLFSISVSRVNQNIIRYIHTYFQ